MKRKSSRKKQNPQAPADSLGRRNHRNCYSLLIVESSSFIALSVGIPRVVIGETIVAFGTSIPEFATSVSSARECHFDLALGNIVGSGFVNITLILGVALVASPLTVNISAFANLALFSLIINLFLWYFLGSERIS